MRENLFIRLQDCGGDGPVPYTVGSADPLQAPLVQSVAASGLAAAAAGRRVIAVVPEADVRLASVQLPVRQAARARQAAPYILEEQFADDVERLHFAVGRRSAAGSFPVAVASHDSMRAWLATLGALGLRVEVMVVETLCLPLPDAHWPVLADAEHLVARSGEYTGFGASPEEFTALLEMAEEGERHAVKVFVCEGCDIDFSRWERPVEVLAGFAHPLEVFARHYAEAHATNLLQGDYGVGEEWQRHLMPWRLPAALAALAMGLAILLSAVQAFELKHQIAQLQQAREDRYRAVFPGEPIQDVDAQIEGKARALRPGGSSPGVLTLLGQLGAALAANPGWQVQALQFRDGALFVDLTGHDLEALERLRTWFGGHPGAALDVQTANASGGTVQVRLKVKPA